jgi:hypothetical protein
MLLRQLTLDNMQKAQEIVKQNQEQELVTVEGLQFKQYQMDLVRFAELDTKGDVKPICPGGG